MDEKAKEFINVSLTEYKELRSELRDIISRQFLIISLTITILGTLFGFSVEKTTNVELIFLLIIPCVSIFSGILWLDCIYRQVKMGTYISLIENKINKLFSYDNKNALNWEHYADAEANTSFIKKINHWGYYFGLAFYLLMPAVSFVYSICVIKKWHWMGWISVLMYICFVFFMFGYFKALSENIVKINGTPLVNQTPNDKEKKK